MCHKEMSQRCNISVIALVKEMINISTSAAECNHKQNSKKCHISNCIGKWYLAEKIETKNYVEAI